MTTTRAARLHRHGEPLRLETVELAEPGPHEVLVELSYAGVNPVDRYSQLGSVAADGPLPRTLGGEASGHLDGRPVLVCGHGLGARRDGLWAGRAVVPAASVVELPPGVDLAAAAAVGIAGRTAWRTVVDLGEVGAGDRVLVLGASGGVGSIAVSLASRRGASVWGQTGDSAKADFVRARGAGEVVVARDASALAGAARELSPNVVLDSLGGEFTAAALLVLEPGGRIVLYGTSAGASGQLPLQLLYRKGARILGFGGLNEGPEAARAGVESALGALAAGRMEVAVDSLVPLERAGEALARLASREVLGNVVLDLTE